MSEITMRLKVRRKITYYPAYALSMLAFALLSPFCRDFDQLAKKVVSLSYPFMYKVDVE